MNCLMKEKADLLLPTSVFFKDSSIRTELKLNLNSYFSLNNPFIKNTREIFHHMREIIKLFSRKTTIVHINQIKYFTIHNQYSKIFAVIFKYTGNTGCGEKNEAFFKIVSKLLSCIIFKFY